ncbi:MAG: FmdB family zinc ribbon protein [Ignavibacteriaceae bacterium]
MPTYDYKCSNCENTFEYFQSMTAETLTECPQCGGKLKRIIGTGAGPIFKGSGFYQTDYKNNSTKSKDSPKTDNPSVSPEKKVKKDDQKKE